MTNLIFHILASVGLTAILIDGKIFNKPRELVSKYIPFVHEIFTCYQCCGFWSGVVCIILLQHTIIYAPWLILCYGFVGSVSATMYLMLIELVYYTQQKLKDTDEQ